MSAPPKIKDTARGVRQSLDNAKSDLSKIREANKGKKDVVKALEEQDKQLTETRELLTKLMFQGSLQLDFLADPLAQVKETVAELAKLLAGSKPERLDTSTVADAIGDVVQATSNLEGQLPGNSFKSKGLVAGKNTLQMVGIVAEKYELKGRVSVDAQDNRVEEGGVQVAGLYSGPAEILARMQENAHKRAAQAEGQKGEVRTTKSGK